MYIVHSTHMNDAHIVNGEEVVTDGFKITDENGEWVDEVLVPTCEEPEPYINAFKERGWLVKDINDLENEGEVFKL